MDLKAWLRQTGERPSHFARRIGKTVAKVSRHCNGAVPAPDDLRDYFLISGGAIRPESFYPVEAWRAELAARAEDVACTR